MSTPIDQLWPHVAEGLDDEQLLAAYAFPPARTWLRMNFVSSPDGAATRDGRSGALGDAADRRVFELLRYPADVVLVAAGTVRVEGYDAMRLADDAVSWRTARGIAPQPVFAMVTRSLDLDPSSAVFTDAPVRPLVYTIADAPAERRAALEAVADVVTAGDSELNLRAVRDDLAARGLHRIHSEGGPSFFGATISAGVVDELCLTVAPSLEGGPAPRIASGPEAAPTPLTLTSVLRAGDELLLRYTAT